MKIHHKTRELHIRDEPAYDLRVIYLVEHFYGMTDEEKPIWLKTKILTKDGWRDLPDGICFPIEKLPSISGKDLWAQGQLERRLEEWKTFIYEHLRD